MSLDVVLVVSFDHTTCSHCGLGANPQTKRHESELPWPASLKSIDRKPCGRKFTAIACDTADKSRAADVRAMRTDLKFVGSGGVVQTNDGWKFMTTKTARELLG